MLQVRPYLFILALMLACQGCTINHRQIILARNGIAGCPVVIPSEPTDIQRFAGGELTRYLGEMSGAPFTLLTGDTLRDGCCIRLQRDQGRVADAYRITSGTRNIILSGNSDRALLYAVYDLLERLGCRWLAPEFEFYHGHAFTIPSCKDISIDCGLNITQTPVFKYRKSDVAEGRSLNLNSLEKIIDWMPRNRLNTLMVPVNMNNRGHMVWDDYRLLVPELDKRGIILEAGQHGYQIFISADMDNGELFRRHPDWFGKDERDHPDASGEVIFNTENQGAVDYFTGNILEYLQAHPEIDIFDLWPPDNAQWPEHLPGMMVPPGRIQADLAGKVYEAISESCPGVRLEVIAFAETLDPAPVKNEIMVDICPINQHFEKQIFDTSSELNRSYAGAVKEWRKNFNGDLGIYTYYRKYAWRSLPNIIPHYMQEDLKWYAGIPVQGISCYAEPGDWYTYELNHFILAELMWDPRVNVDSLINVFSNARYGKDYALAEDIYSYLEETVRIYGNIRNSSLKPESEIEKALEKLRNLVNDIQLAQTMVTKEAAENLEKLAKMIKYTELDLEIQGSRSSGKSGEEMAELFNDLIMFKLSVKDEGIIVTNYREDLSSLREHYGLIK